MIFFVVMAWFHEGENTSQKSTLFSDLPECAMLYLWRFFSQFYINWAIPCSEDTCWNVLICLTPKTFTSFGTFCILVSSPDHIWFGDMIPAVSWIFIKSWNQFPINVGFAPIARVMDRLWAFFRVMSGWHTRNRRNHFLLAVCLSSLNPGMLFTFAYWYAS